MSQNYAKDTIFQKIFVLIFVKREDLIFIVNFDNGFKN